MRAILTYTPQELREAFAQDGLEPFRASQVVRWIYGRGEHDFAAMSNLSRGARGHLASRWSSRSLELEDALESSDGTRKLLLRTADGGRLESVIIPEGERRTLCLSSQLGCSLDCPFCATGRLGLGRNLGADEIVDQALHARALLGRKAEKLTHVVFMGMGEPLLNLRNVVQAIRILTDPQAGSLATRRITVSTAGVVPRIEALGRAVRVRLAISLHATTDALRDRLVPLNRRFPLASLLDACRRFPLTRRDRISFEYALMKGVNDGQADARRLVRLLHGLRAKVNLIPLNEHAASPYRRPSASVVEAFAELLAAGGLTATVRRSRGGDILAACGQLGALAPDGQASSGRAVR
ncbi:MAG: 23S rRNA (adenine(2503)-C(2))-methyltransferase RlmN [Myxococcota bacterium]